MKWLRKTDVQLAAYRRGQSRGRSGTILQWLANFTRRTPHDPRQPSKSRRPSRDDGQRGFSLLGGSNPEAAPEPVDCPFPINATRGADLRDWRVLP